MTTTTITQLTDPQGFSPDPLTELLRSGAQRLIEQAVEAELAVLLEAYASEKTDDGRARLVRHGHLPEREIMTAMLSSDVMEQRPMAIHRSIRQPSDQLPEPLELKAQIEETYGPPSRIEINGREMTLTYAWGEDGFIVDLDALPPLVHEETFASGRVRRSEYELCGNAQHYRNNVEYRFKHPRNEDIKTGCIATFTVRYHGEPGSTVIGFSLEDFELGRLHMRERDRQIVEALTGKEIEASDMDL